MEDDPRFTRLFASVLRIETEHGHGSGARVGDAVLTAAHVVVEDGQPAKSTTVWALELGRKVPAVVTGFDEEWDLAILRPESHANLDGLQGWDLGDGGYLGEQVLHAGFPGGGPSVPTVRTGWINASLAASGMAVIVDRNMAMSDDAGGVPLAHLIDVPVFPGNSGGPVIDSAGDLIGVLSQGWPGTDLGVSVRAAAGLGQSGLDQLLR